MIKNEILDLEIKLRTRAIFNSAKKYRNKRKQYNIDWNFLVQTLSPLPQSKEYHIDHIIPLSNFNFVHEDGSINITEIKKAWSPANLRILCKEDNLHKGNSLDSYSYPLRFEFVFGDLEKIKEMYGLLNRLSRIARNIKVVW